ncbi:per1 [Symbiodinium sp. CCMP2456]|nr:per1 [Symbiodinium sp. CCMP2456]
MFGNFVENLGLKEGFAEFKEQLNKEHGEGTCRVDAKTTIANTQFAKDRGIDVAKLDEWEQQIQEQAANTTAELHDRTIGRAVESLAQDETIAQLLELQSEKEAVIEEPSEAAVASAEGGPASEAEAPTIAQEEAKAKPRSHPDREDIQSLRRSRDEAMAQAEALQARLADVSAVSDEALEKAAHEAWLLKRAVEEKDAALASASEVHAKLEEQMVTAQRRLEDLEANFLERLQREVSQKEQELLDEVAYLRRAGEAKERRVQDLQAENGALERRLLVKASSGVSDAGDVMLEAHTAIAQAFGDLSAQHPCLRLLDEPILCGRLLALLFKQPLFRRMFFAASAFLWAFSLLHALTSDHGETIHV